MNDVASERIAIEGVESSRPRNRRKLRNLLLDKSLQLRLVGAFLLGLLAISVLLGAFLLRMSNELLQQTNAILQSRLTTAQLNRDISMTTVASRISEPNLVDWDTAEAVRLKIEGQYEAEVAASQREHAAFLQKRNAIHWAVGLALLAFTLLSIVAGLFVTHRLAGPVYRVGRILADVRAGKLLVPTYGLRRGDQLKELFKDTSETIALLRQREEQEIAALQEALEVGAREGLSPAARAQLIALQDAKRARLAA